jgi:hypothetical protein
MDFTLLRHGVGKLKRLEIRQNKAYCDIHSRALVSSEEC